VAERRTGAKSTDERILIAALDAFGTRGFEATSLDGLAAELGVRKQTILYWYPSKDVLLAAVIDRTALEVTNRLERAVDVSEPGFGRVEAIVRSMSRLSARYPAMLGFMREVSRLGPPASSRLTAAIAPLVDRASAYLTAEMDAGRMRRHDPRTLLLAAYSMVTGLGTEAETLTLFGEAPTLRSLIRRRDALLDVLRATLVDEDSGTV
jgi:AcrR family transcriptional regulator